MRLEVVPLGAGERESVGVGLEVEEVSVDEEAGLSAGEGESNGAGEGESDRAGDGVSVEDCESVGDGPGDSVEGDDELLVSAIADTAPAGPAMIDPTMQTTRMKALGVFLTAPPVRLAPRAPGRPNKPSNRLLRP